MPGYAGNDLNQNMILQKKGRVRKEREKVEKCSNKTENKTEKTEGGFDTKYILMSFTFSCFLSI